MLSIFLAPFKKEHAYKVARTNVFLVIFIFVITNFIILIPTITRSLNYEGTPTGFLADFIKEEADLSSLPTCSVGSNYKFVCDEVTETFILKTKNITIILDPSNEYKISDLKEAEMLFQSDKFYLMHTELKELSYMGVNGFSTKVAADYSKEGKNKTACEYLVGVYYKSVGTTSAIQIYPLAIMGNLILLILMSAIMSFGQVRGSFAMKFNTLVCSTPLPALIAMVIGFTIEPGFSIFVYLCLTIIAFIMINKKQNKYM